MNDQPDERGYVDWSSVPLPPDSAGPATPLPANPEPTLPYRDVREDRKGSTKRFLLHMLGGFAVALVICGACFAGLYFVGDAVTSNFESSRPAHQPAAKRALGWGSLAVVTVILVGLVWWAIRAHRRRARTGFFVGMLIGIGLSLLPLGLCYAIIGDEVIR